MVTNRVGPPVRGEDCFGRDGFVDMVWEKLSTGNVMLAGPRRFGKTSIMYRLIDDPRLNFQVLRADLEALDSPAALITELMVKLAGNNRTDRALDGLSNFGRALISAVRSNVDEIELLQVKLKLRAEIGNGWQDRGQALFRKIAQLDHRVVFILDEFPMMIDRMARSKATRDEARTLLRWFRALRLAPDTRNVRFLIAGSIGIGYVLNDLGEVSAINDFEQVRLDPFNRRTADRFLHALAETHGLPLSGEGVDAIIGAIGTLVPYFLQVLFSEVHKAHRIEEEPVTAELVARVYHERVLGVDCKTYFDHYYGRLRSYYRPQEERAARRILREMAATGMLAQDVCYSLYRQEMRKRGDVDAFNRLTTNLENDFYIRFDASAGRYEFACKVLRDWWLRHYGMSVGD